MFKSMLVKYAEHNLAKSIVNYDLPGVHAALDRGARKIDFLLMQQADFGNGSAQIPAGKFHDPVKLAQHVGFKQALPLFEQYGVSPSSNSSPALRK